VSLPDAVRRAARAALDKKATDVVALDLRPGSFTDFFLLASAANQKQIVAIADAVQETLREQDHLRPAHVEGYPRQEWILLDYGSFVVHLFTPRMRTFYDLERLWGGATRVEVAG
jgi:ribosome-associated protein